MIFSSSGNHERTIQMEQTSGNDRYVAIYPTYLTLGPLWLCFCSLLLVYGG